MQTPSLAILEKDAEIEYWEFREENIEKLSISTWNGLVKDLAFTHKFGYSLRVLCQGGWGFVHSDSMKLPQMVETAKSMARALSEKNQKEKSVFFGTDIRDKKSNPLQIPFSEVSLEEKKKMMLDLSKKPSETKIKSLAAFHSEILKCKEFRNSLGSHIEQTLVYGNGGLSATAQMDGRTETFDTREGIWGGYEIAQKYPSLRQDAIRVAVDLLQATVPKGGVAPSVCDGALTDVFVHEAVGHASEADLIMEGCSCLANKIGETLADNSVTIYDDATIAGEWGSYYYDEEGIESKKTPIVVKGILKGYLHSRKSAAALDAEPTGNGRAQDVACLPQVRMSNTYMEKGKWSFEELLKEAKNGFYLKGSRGGQVDTLTGNFQFSTAYGYEIVDGILGKMVKDVALSGNTLQILRSIGGISNKYERGFPGHCGKGGQLVPVKGDCPSIFIQKAMVGGQ